MTTITITKENFWQKMSLIYKKVNLAGKVRIKFDDTSTIYTAKNHTAYLKSKEQLQKWEAFSLSDLKAKYL